MNPDSRLQWVLNQYPVSVSAVEPVKGRRKKAVWRLTADGATYYLKGLRVEPGRMAFIAAAARHLRQRGILVPSVVETYGGRDFVVAGGYCYLLLGEAEGEKPRYRKKRHLRLIMVALARFHRASAGFETQEEMESHILLGSWPEFYARQEREFSRFLAEASRCRDRFSKILLAHGDRFLNHIRSLRAELERSAYRSWVETAGARPYLCHQDFAPSNLRLTRSGRVQVFDLDSLCIDLPARDIRKILNKAVRKGPWSTSLVRKLVKDYQRVHPLSAAQWHVTFINAEFPRLLCSLVSRYYTRPRSRPWTKEEYAAALARTVRWEDAKVKALGKMRKELLRRLPGPFPEPQRRAGRE